MEPARLRRVASPVSPNAIVYALGVDGTLIGQSRNRQTVVPTLSVESGIGPLAASSGAVYYQEDHQLVAATSPGVVQWRADAPDDLTSAAIADDGTIIAAAEWRFGYRG